MKNSQQGFAEIGALIVIILWVAAIGGWIANIVKLIGMVDGSVTTMFVLRVVGIFAAPLGSILGYF